MADTEKTGTLMTREDKEHWERALTVAQHYGLSNALAQRLNQYKFVSDVQTERVKAATQLVAAEQQFMEAYTGHQLAHQRLLSVHDEARDREEMRRLDNEARLLELQIQRDQLHHQLNQQIKDSGRMTNRDVEDELEKIHQKATLEAAKKAAQVKAKIQIRRDLRRKRDEVKAEALRDAGGVVTPELEQELKNIDDSYQELLDNL